MYLFIAERKHERAANLANPDWLTKLLYLSCIFEKINSCNLSLQGESVNGVKASNKIKAFKKKIQQWAGRIENGRMDIFSELNDFLKENKISPNIVKQFIIIHLRDLSQWFDKFFPGDTTPQKHEWILSPSTVANTHHLFSDLIEALNGLSSDRGLKIAFDTKRTLAEF